MRVSVLPLSSFVCLTLCVVPVRDQLVNPLNCGGVFNSLTTKSGHVTSPNYPKPYPFDIVCHFRLVGTGKERVQMTFVKLDLDYPNGDPSDPKDCQDVDSVAVTVWLRDTQKVIGLYCGTKKTPMLMSPGPHLDLIFTTRRSTHSTHASQGFQANYSFLTDYGIRTGRQNESLDCVFVYESVTRESGNFTSPNFPGLYPSNTTCHYLFFAKPDERVQIRFIYFAVEGVPPGCLRETQSDFVEFSNFNIDLTDRKMVHFCGSRLESRQKVIQSDGNFFRVTFKSNEIYEDIGFGANYEFVQFEDPLESRRSARSSASTSSLSGFSFHLELVLIAGSVGFAWSLIA